MRHTRWNLSLIHIWINEAKGVVSSTGEAADGMGYAIPINEAEPILNNLMNRQTRDKTSEEEQGFLGVSLSLIHI